ncbi:MAG: AraC family transcriptional regulator [Bacteroidota bacterium]|nr:AraC family transcriptional regulator [Bacteroidota bacterium]
MKFTDYDIECIKKAKSIIDADTSRHFTIEFIATKIHIGETKLKKGFKHYYKVGLFTYLRKQRMIKAAELILETNKTIKQIAKASGFKHPSNFITAFTSYHGLTPTKYRSHFLNE